MDCTTKGYKREIAIFYSTLSPVSSAYSPLFVESMIRNIGKKKLYIAFSCVYVAPRLPLVHKEKYIEQSKRYNFQNKEFHCFLYLYIPMYRLDTNNFVFVDKSRNSVFYHSLI